MDAIKQLIEKFSTQLEMIIDNQARVRALGALDRLGGAGTREVKAKTKRTRRKGPIQLCPVPRCKERAAPIFGMLCAKHKDTPKAKVRKYREARRASNG